MENLFRELSIMNKSILVLDDAESFLKETSIIKPLTRLFKNNEAKNGKRVLCVIICNIIDKSLSILCDICDIIEFKPLGHNQMYRIFRTLSTKVSKFSYIPPMASFMISTHSSGNILQAVNQLQFLYQNTPFPITGKKNKNKKLKLDKSSKNDNHFQMWVSTYKQSNIKYFIENKKINVLDCLFGMNKSFLDNIGDNLYKEYINYFDKTDSLESVSRCICDISCADLKRPEFDNDRLYDTENSEKWSEDDHNYLINTYSGIRILQGREHTNYTNKRRRKKKFKFEN